MQRSEKKGNCFALAGGTCVAADVAEEREARWWRRRTFPATESRRARSVRALPPFVLGYCSAVPETEPPLVHRFRQRLCVKPKAGKREWARRRLSSLWS